LIRPVRVRGDPENAHVTGAGLDHEQAAQAPQGHRAIHVEEIGGEHTSGSWAMHGGAQAWLVRMAQFAIISMLFNSGKLLLVYICERSVQGRRRKSAVNGG
jgi:hypothetical protein